MPGTFKVTVTDANGKTSVKTAQVGGGNLTAQQAEELLIKAGTFGKARSVKVEDPDQVVNKTVGQIAEEQARNP